MGRNSGIPCEEIYKEEWRDIKDWAGYQVSDLGRVRHWDSGWWIVNQKKQNRHKKFVVLSVKGIRWTVLVDRLVLKAFVGARLGKWIIHLNHDIEDNALNNLQYSTRKEYLQWLKEHWGAIGKTKTSEYKVAVHF